MHWGMLMKVGDLVKIKNASVSAPLNSIGLIVKVENPSPNRFDIKYYSVRLCDGEGQIIRRAAKDLEVIGANRGFSET